MREGRARVTQLRSICMCLFFIGLRSCHVCRDSKHYLKMTDLQLGTTRSLGLLHAFVVYLRYLSYCILSTTIYFFIFCCCFYLSIISCNHAHGAVGKKGWTGWDWEKKCWNDMGGTVLTESCTLATPVFPKNVLVGL